jgi:O-antigen ligase
MNIAARLRTAAGWIILASLVYAPWALGCRPIWAIQGLLAIVLLAAVFWLPSRIGRPIRGWHRWCALALLAQGWWMIFNAHGDYQPSGDITPVQSWWPSAPGAVDAGVCRVMMCQITAVLIAFLIACDLVRERLWRWRIVATIAATGVALSIYGLLQKADLLPALAHRAYAESVFATFDYHGNAGAFLNLCIPGLFAIAVGTRFKRTGWLGVMLCLAASMANVSRAGVVISLVMIVILALTLARSSPRMAGGIALAVIIATVAGGGAAWRRLGELNRNQTLNNPRLLMLQAAGPMAMEAGPLGNGSGSFKLIYFNSPHIPAALYPRWRVAPYPIGETVPIDSFAHHDYLQYIIEWGWLGAALWAILIIGGVVVAIRAYRKEPGEDRILLAAALAALGGVLVHSLVDWPLQVGSLQLYAAMYLAVAANPLCASC